MTTTEANIDVGRQGAASRARGRRKQLIDAAVAVMERTGYHQMSMQALSEEAGVSVGLAYKYFSGKEDVLEAAITGILEDFSDQIQPAIDEAGECHVDRLAAGFRRYLDIIDANIPAVLLSYRESGTLSPEGRNRLKELELATAAPLRSVIEDGIDAGVFTPVDVDLVVVDLVLITHGWALKHWFWSRTHTLDEYHHAQLGFFLHSLIAPDQQARYQRHFTPDPPGKHP